MLVLQTVFVWIRTIPASRTAENSGSFTEAARGEDAAEGAAKAPVKGRVSPANNEERNSSSFFHYVLFIKQKDGGLMFTTRLEWH